MVCVSVARRTRENPAYVGTGVQHTPGTDYLGIGTLTPPSALPRINRRWVPVRTPHPSHSRDDVPNLTARCFVADTRTERKCTLEEPKSSRILRVGKRRETTWGRRHKAQNTPNVSRTRRTHKKKRARRSQMVGHYAPLVHCRPSPSPTVNVYSTPACQGRARLDGSSRRPPPTPTRTREHARTHTHAHPHTRAQARARDRAHAHAQAPARERERAHAHAHARKRTTHTHTRKHTRPSPHPRRQQGRPT